jgi:CheY-like chemotaxis protein
MAAILLVDDDPEVLATLAEMLRTAGHAVTTATGGLPALDILDRGEGLDLLLTDVIMPGLNGFNLARMAFLRRPDLKMLYLTGYAETEEVMRDGGKRHGKLLRKPIGYDELVEEVDTALAG